MNLIFVYTFSVCVVWRGYNCLSLCNPVLYNDDEPWFWQFLIPLMNYKLYTTAHWQLLIKIKKVTGINMNICEFSCVFPTWQVTETRRSQTSHQPGRTHLSGHTNIVNKTHETCDMVFNCADSGAGSVNWPLLARQSIPLLVLLCGKPLDPDQTCSGTFSSDIKL